MQQTQGQSVMVAGRIVWVAGDLFKGIVQTDTQTKQPKLDAQGQPKMEYGFGLAVPIEVLQQVGPGQPGDIWRVIHEEAYTLYPSRQVPPGFAWKYKTADSIDPSGKPYGEREGYAGHVVFTLKTMFPLKFFKWENGSNILINEGIKCGDYVNVQVNVKAHGAVGQGKPGLYLNPMAVQLIGYGTEIKSAGSVDPNATFGTSQPPLPPGATAVPQAPMGGAPLVSSQPAGLPQPNYGVLPQAHQPQAVQAPPQADGVPPMPQQPQAVQVPPMPSPMPSPTGMAQGVPGLPQI